MKNVGFGIRVIAGVLLMMLVGVLTTRAEIWSTTNGDSNIKGGDTALGHSTLADSLSLTVAKGINPGEIDLDWTGAAAPFQVHRSAQPAGVVAPANLVARTNAFTYTDTNSPPGGSVFYLVVQEWPLTVNRSGTGGVTRDGVAACDVICPETTGYPDGASVTLVARPQNGSGYFFSGWSGACAGPARTCIVTMSQARSVTAIFSPIDRNLAFVSSATFATTLGGAQLYDSQCNSLATAAGINDVTGNAFVAWMSDATSNARARLGASARGWVRMDGRPFADTQSDLFSNNVVFHPIRLDENGTDPGRQLVLTGANNDSATGNHCNGWTGSGFMTTGNAASGPYGWTLSSSNTPCAATGRIYCLMKTKSLALAISPAPGKRIYLSGAFTPDGATTPNFRCDLDKPAGAGTVRALIATPLSAASSVLTPSQTYVRPDGVVVGTGAQLTAGGLLTSGIWQTGGGAYIGSLQGVWTGHTSLTGFGTTASTCGNWTSTAGSGTTGTASSTDTLWWNSASLSCSTAAIRLFCVEQ